MRFPSWKELEEKENYFVLKRTAPKREGSKEVIRLTCKNEKVWEVGSSVKPPFLIVNMTAKHDNT